MCRIYKNRNYIKRKKIVILAKLRCCLYIYAHSFLKRYLVYFPSTFMCCLCYLSQVSISNYLIIFINIYISQCIDKGCWFLPSFFDLFLSAQNLYDEIPSLVVIVFNSI